MASTLYYTLGSSMMSLATNAKDMGTAISINHASRAIVGIIAPPLGGWILKRGSSGRRTNRPSVFNSDLRPASPNSCVVLADLRSELNTRGLLY